MKQERSKNYTNKLYNPIADLDRSQIEVRKQGKPAWPSAKPSGVRARPKKKK